MITYNRALVCLALLMASCNNEGRTSYPADTTSDSAGAGYTAAKDTVPTGCYLQASGKDTSALQIDARDNTVSGSLSYRIFEKDRNEGTLQADRSGDIIRGWYLFRSEGIISVREVAWKINGEELWPASGEVMQRNDTAMFADPGNLQFDSSHPFRKVPCIL